MSPRYLPWESRAIFPRFFKNHFEFFLSLFRFFPVFFGGGGLPFQEREMRRREQDSAEKRRKDTVQLQVDTTPWNVPWPRFVLKTTGSILVLNSSKIYR